MYSCICVATSENDSLTTEIESWKNGFAYALRAEDGELFVVTVIVC